MLSFWAQHTTLQGRSYPGAWLPWHQSPGVSVRSLHGALWRLEQCCRVSPLAAPAPVPPAPATPPLRALSAGLFPTDLFDLRLLEGRLPRASPCSVHWQAGPCCYARTEPAPAIVLLPTGSLSKHKDQQVLHHLWDGVLCGLANLQVSMACPRLLLLQLRHVTWLLGQKGCLVMGELQGRSFFIGAAIGKCELRSSPFAKLPGLSVLYQ